MRARIAPLAALPTLAFAALPILALVAPAAAQDPSARFGVWQLRSDAPPPSVNIMTYEPYGDGGMRITVRSTNRDGETTEWGYVTLFDGQFRPVTGQQNAETAVEFVDARTTRIQNRRNGRVSQVIMNVLSEDGNHIENEYIRIAEDGTESSTHATYDRVMTDPSQFVGTWELVSLEQQTEPNVWEPVEEWADPVGYIIYDADGHMSAQLTADPRPVGRRSGEVVDGFVSYFGHYEVNLTEGTVSHHRIGHVNPELVGTTVKRFFEFDGDLLRLTPAPERTLRLTWRRVSG